MNKYQLDKKGKNSWLAKNIAKVVSTTLREGFLFIQAKRRDLLVA